MVLTFISYLGVLQASSKQSQVKYLTPTPPCLSKVGSQRKFQQMTLCIRGRKHFACVCIHIHIHIHTHTHTHISLSSPTPRPTASIFQPRMHCRETIHPLHAKLGPHPGTILGLWQNHFPPSAVILEASCDGTTFTGCLICSLRKTVCSERYIGLFRNISGVG